MKTIWSSKMENILKIRTLKATIEPILLYDSECWTIDSTMCKHIYYCYIYNSVIWYTRLLRMATKVSWKDNVTNTQLYRGMPKITEVIKLRILRLSGHCIRHTDEIAHN